MTFSVVCRLTQQSRVSTDRMKHVLLWGCQHVNRSGRTSAMIANDTRPDKPLIQHSQNKHVGEGIDRITLNISIR